MRSRSIAFTCERRDGSRHRADPAGPRRSPRRSTPPRRWWNRLCLGRQPEISPRSHPNRFQPALDARPPSLIPCTQSCKRSRLKKFFSPGRACCSDCLKVRRPPRPLPPDPILLMCPIPPFADRAQKRPPTPQHRKPRRMLTSPPNQNVPRARRERQSEKRIMAKRQKKASRSARRWRRRLGRRGDAPAPERGGDPSRGDPSRGDPPPPDCRAPCAGPAAQSLEAQSRRRRGAERAAAGAGASSGPRRRRRRRRRRSALSPR